MNLQPKHLQFGDEGAENVRRFGKFNVIKVGNKTALQGPESGMIMPTDVPMGGEEIMKQRKMGRA